jgi:hypothetical protein
MRTKNDFWMRQRDLDQTAAHNTKNKLVKMLSAIFNSLNKRTSEDAPFYRNEQDYVNRASIQTKQSMRASGAVAHFSSNIAAPFLFSNSPRN